MSGRSGVLSGTRLLVSRPESSPPDLAERLRALGARVSAIATTRVEALDPEPLRRALRRLDAYRGVVFTSRHAVRIVLEELRALGVDQGVLARLEVIVIGPATAATLEQEGLPADLVARRFTAEGILETLASRGPVSGWRLLYPAAAGARDVLPLGLRARGAEVDVVPIYRSVAVQDAAVRVREMVSRHEIDLIVVTSGSSARAVWDAVADPSALIPVASIGPATTAVARDLGMHVAAEAREATVEGLVDAVVAWRSESAGR